MRALLKTCQTDEEIENAENVVQIDMDGASERLKMAIERKQQKLDEMREGQGADRGAGVEAQKMEVEGAASSLEEANVLNELD